MLRLNLFFFLLLLHCCIFSVYCAAQQNDSMIKRYKEECAKQTNVSADMMEKMDLGDVGKNNEALYNDRNTKCFMSCLLEKCEFAKNGPPTFKNMKQLLNFKDDENGFVGIAKECWNARKDTDDKCEGKFTLYKCIMERSKMSLKDTEQNTEQKGEGKEEAAMKGGGNGEAAMKGNEKNDGGEKKEENGEGADKNQGDKDERRGTEGKKNDSAAAADKNPSQQTNTHSSTLLRQSRNNY